MKTLLIALCLCLFASNVQAADVIIRTKPGKTLLQAANEIKNYLNRSNVSAAKIEDMLGDCMTPVTTATTTLKGAIGQKYVRIRIPDAWVNNLVAIAPSAVNCELVGVNIGRYEVDPDVFLGEFA